MTDETLKYALATGRVAEAMKLQEMASTLTRLGQQAQALGVKSSTATNTLVSGLLAARENLKRAGATPLPYSLDFEVSSGEIGKLDKAVMSRLRMEGGKSFISIGDLGYLDEATKKTVVLRKAEEMAAAEAKAGMKLQAESHRDLAADIAAEQKALAEKAAVEKRLAGDTKALYEGIKNNSTIIAPLSDVEPTSLEKWTAAWEDYSKAFDATERSAANLSLSPEELNSRLDGVREAFVKAVSGLDGLDSGKVGVIRSINAAIGETPEAAQPAAESIAEVAESLEQVKKSLDSGMDRFGDFGKLAAAAMKAIVPEGQIRAIDDFLKKYGEGFGALFQSIGGTATLAFETLSEAQVTALEEQIAQLERQKEAYKESSDNEIAILEAKGESTVDARIRQAAEEEKLQESIDRKKSALARRQFNADKQAKLAQIAMATALGVANTASAGAWAIPLAGGITALGIIQAGIVNGQKYPEAFDGAYLPGSSSGTLLRAGERNQPEIVLPLREEKLKEFGIGGGSGVSIGQVNIYSAAEDPREVARAVRTELERLGRTNR